MTESTIWWLLAGGAVAVELITGTFYLLMIAVGLAAAALAAHAGAPLTVQVLVAAVVGGGTVVVWHWKRSKSARPAKAQANRDVQMDIGETVHVTAWNEDGTASVKYRGAQWTVVLADKHAVLTTGYFTVKSLDGNRLVVHPQ